MTDHNLDEHLQPDDQQLTEAQATQAPALGFAQLLQVPELLRAVTEQGYTIPTPIQQQAIPLILAQRDLMGGAQTGTGKTAAFTLPLLQLLSAFANNSPSPAKHPLRALIITPTRELALQVHDSVEKYGQFLPLRSLCVFGGVDIKPQIEVLRGGVEILVSTPGRLLDHVENRSVNFSQVSMLVLDEADRMLDMGFIPDITRILNMLPQKRQSLLFSATFSEEIKRLADRMLKNPLLIEVAKRNTVSETITHRVHPIAASDKKSLLLHILQADELSQAIIFVRTKQGCSRLVRELTAAGLSADAIHGDKNQQERIKALTSFKNGEVAFLVATDVAARGLDIDELPFVINYELPHTPEDYVHRIGRTGRAGKTGTAISLVATEEIRYLWDIEQLIQIKIYQCVVPGFEADADYIYPPLPPAQRGHANHAVSRKFLDNLPRHSYHCTTPIHVQHSAPRQPSHARKPFPTNQFSGHGHSNHSGHGSHSGHSSHSSHGGHAYGKNRNIAADGFDFTKPYQPSASALSNNDNRADFNNPTAKARSRLTPIAALLTPRIAPVEPLQKDTHKIP